ncbi:hypothetical protein KIN20_012919 [Parelaphostrongylus tenuis]|uniref:H15 domain-containing protein n=1 Tax=Parelaphostrongylus tenuis TaxID=148309 RepID=A0AAD5MBD7_PARTN|nr:hypothetical protein KIN20_012919 [Parelaphostrongylus tenuis]
MAAGPREKGDASCGKTDTDSKTSMLSASVCSRAVHAELFASIRYHVYGGGTLMTLPPINVGILVFMVNLFFLLTWRCLLMLRLSQRRTAKVARLSRPHPPYSVMVRQAISELQDSSGLSKAAIHRYMAEKYPLGNNNNLINSNVRLALQSVERGALVQVSGSDMDGSFKLGEKLENKASLLKHKNLSASWHLENAIILQTFCLVLERSSEKT